MDTPTLTPAEQIELKYLSLYCEAILGSPLVESDSHDKEECGGIQPYMTKNQEFYFVPLPDCPVMTGPRIGHEPEPIPGRFEYAVEVVKIFPGSHWEPDEYDQIEVDRAQSLTHALDAAAHHQLDMKLQNIGEGLYYQKEKEMEPLVTEYMNSNRDFPRH